MSDPREKFAGCPVTVKEGHFDADSGNASLFRYREGSKGVCSKHLPYNEGFLYIHFDSGDSWIDPGCSAAFFLKSGDTVPRTWVVPIEALDFDLSFFNDPYYKPGINGWIPDRIAEGIDVMKVTADLVSQEVGK